MIKLNAFIENEQVMFDLEGDFLEPFKVVIDGNIYRAGSMKKLRKKVQGSNRKAIK